MSDRLEILDGTTWESFVRAPVAVLVLGKSDCEACKAWSEELTAFLAQDERWRGVRFGKIQLDRPGLASFKRANPWLAEADTLPFNVIYVNGEPAKRYSGGGVDRLVNRLERATATS
jgi:hypothetical protein